MIKLLSEKELNKIKQEFELLAWVIRSSIVNCGFFGLTQEEKDEEELAFLKQCSEKAEESKRNRGKNKNNVVKIGA